MGKVDGKLENFELKKIKMSIFWMIMNDYGVNKAVGKFEASMFNLIQNGYLHRRDHHGELNYARGQDMKHDKKWS